MRVVLTLSVGIATVLAVTWLSTTYEYRRRVRNAQKASKGQPIPVPNIPYIIPGLGSTITFANQKIGAYWQYLSAECRRQAINAVSITLNNKRTHLIISPEGVLSTFKARQLSRFSLDQQLGRNCLGMSKQDAERAFPPDLDHKTSLTTERIHSNMLLSGSAVNVLTNKFMEVFQARLRHEKIDANGSDVDLYTWIRNHMFHASTTSLCGSQLLAMYPDLAEDFWQWDDGLLSMLFGTPRLFAREAYAARDKLVGQLQAWLEAGYASTADEKDVDWETSFGSRVVRKRHEYYAQQQMSLKGQAGADLIFLGGILSNAIPATGWFLMHIFSPTNPPELLPWVMDEIKSAQKPDGSIDIATLSNQPLLNSIFQEVLRLHVDLLVVRNVDTDVNLGPHLAHRDNMIMAPSWMSHRHSDNFSKPEAFDPARFITEDPASGKMRFSTAGLDGKLFPFGGGHYMCPGRTFAKQEVLGAVAALLLNFDVEVDQFVASKRKSSVGAGRSASGFPKHKDNYAGNVVVGLDGDLRVKLKGK